MVRNASKKQLMNQTMGPATHAPAAPRSNPTKMAAPSVSMAVSTMPQAA